MIIGPDTMGVVSLRFSGVTLRAALDAILRAKGYQYQVFDNILLVSAPDSLEKGRGFGMETQLVKLKFSDASDIKRAVDSARVLSPWGNANVYARAKGGAASTGAGALARSDILLITDRAPNIKRALELIEGLDRPVRQIAIDVQFVETTLGDDQQMGIDWQQLLKAQGNYQGRTEWNLGGAIDAATGGAVQFGSLATTQFNVTLELLLRENRSKLLSQPRLTTIEDQPATISVGLTTWISQTSGAGGAAGAQITFTERTVPIKLEVVPHILHNDRIMLELKPQVEEITGWLESGGSRLPLISTRQADTRIEVRDGGTAVIGGLIRDQKIWEEKRVWLLGSLPLIGPLFRHQVDHKERSDLSIFITPRILKDDVPVEAAKEPTKK